MCRKLASDNGLWLSLGGVHSLREAGAERPSNRHLVISDTGAVVASYDKAHLFDVEIPGSVSLCESAYVDPGQQVTLPLDTPLGKLGLGVCYDLRSVNVDNDSKYKICICYQRNPWHGI